VGRGGSRDLVELIVLDERSRRHHQARGGVQQAHGQAGLGAHAQREVEAGGVQGCPEALQALRVRIVEGVDGEPLAGDVRAPAERRGEGRRLVDREGRRRSPEVGLGRGLGSESGDEPGSDQEASERRHGPSAQAERG